MRTPFAVIQTRLASDSKSRLRLIARISAGFSLVIVGTLLALPGVPGPGIALIVVGLLLLEPHFVWARKSLAWVRERIQRVRKRSAGC